MDNITSAKNPMVQRLRALKSAKVRREQGLFLVEGEVMIREALGCGLKMRELVADDGAAGLCTGTGGRWIACSAREPDVAGIYLRNAHASGRLRFV